jgi:hypothetical protein
VAGVVATKHNRSVLASHDAEHANMLIALDPVLGAILRLVKLETPSPWSVVDRECEFVLPANIDLLPRPLTLSLVN